MITEPPTIRLEKHTKKHHAIWQLTHNTWHMTHYMCHVTHNWWGRWMFFQNSSSLALTVCEWRCTEDSFTKDHWLNDWITQAVWKNWTSANILSTCTVWFGILKPYFLKGCIFVYGKIQISKIVFSISFWKALFAHVFFRQISNFYENTYLAKIRGFGVVYI